MPLVVFADPDPTLKQVADLFERLLDVETVKVATPAARTPARPLSEEELVEFGRTVLGPYEKEGVLGVVYGTGMAHHHDLSYGTEMVRQAKERGMREPVEIWLADGHFDDHRRSGPYTVHCGEYIPQLFDRTGAERTKFIGRIKEYGEFPRAGGRHREGAIEIPSEALAEGEPSPATPGRKILSLNDLDCLRMQDMLTSYGYRPETGVSTEVLATWLDANIRGSGVPDPLLGFTLLGFDEEYAPILPNDHPFKGKYPEIVKRSICSYAAVGAALLGKGPERIAEIIGMMPKISGPDKDSYEREYRKIVGNGRR